MEEVAKAEDSTSAASHRLSAADSTGIITSPSPVLIDMPGVPINPSGDPDAPTSGHSADSDGQGSPHLTFVLALHAFVAAVMLAILPDCRDTVGGWSTAPKVVYDVIAVLTIALLAVGLMAAGWHAVPVAVQVAGSSNSKLSVSAFCAKILSSVLLVVAISCKFGGCGCVAGVPSAAVIAAVMAVVWMWGDERATEVVSKCWRPVAASPRRSPPPAAISIPSGANHSIRRGSTAASLSNAGEALELAVSSNCWRHP